VNLSKKGFELREYISVVPPSMGMGDWKIALAVDLNDESAYAGRWAVANYLCPGYTVMILMSDQQVFFMEQIGGHQIKYWPLTKNSNKRWKRTLMFSMLPRALTLQSHIWRLISHIIHRQWKNMI